MAGINRGIVASVVLGLIAMLSLSGCTAAPASVKAPEASRATAAWQGFSVSGDHPVAADGSQDTNAQADGEACDSAQLAINQALGGQIATGFAASSFPTAADLLRHFLKGTGTAVNYPAGSQISKLASASPEFAAVRGEVQAAVTKQLAAGKSRVLLSAGQLPLATFGSTSSDLYWAFRGTQGLTVTGSGTRKGGRYVGTLTFVIRDIYGFPVDDTLGGFGPPMRYLQTVCGAPQHAGGAHWFPDSVTVTVPFNRPA
ncbi:MAG TPA: hypothetical protein VIZ43_10695 [Trebonia sp.]